VRVLEISSHQPGQVCHVGNEHGADSIGDLAEAFEVHNPGVSAGAGDNHLRLVFPGQFFYFVIVQTLCFTVNSVGNEPVPFP